jgi:hypothetical protein
MLPPSHLTNNNNYSSSSNRSRSRSPHPSLHHHHHHHSSSSLLNKNSSSPPPPLHSSSRKRNSPNMKSDISKNSSHPPPPIIPLPPTFGAFDPLTLSIIERQRLSAAYASLFAAASQPNNFFPGNLDGTTFRHNGSSSLFPNLDSSSQMTAALMQREHFLNSLRQQQEQIERERAAIASINKSSKSIPTIHPPVKTEQTSPKVSIEEPPRISPKVITSPGSHSSTSSSSSSSKKVKHVKREKELSSPNENTEITLKEELNIESTPSIPTTT